MDGNEGSTTDHFESRSKTVANPGTGRLNARVDIHSPLPPTPPPPSFPSSPLYFAGFLLGWTVFELHGLSLKRTARFWLARIPSFLFLRPSGITFLRVSSICSLHWCALIIVVPGNLTNRLAIHPGFIAMRLKHALEYTRLPSQLKLFVSILPSSPPLCQRWENCPRHEHYLPSAISSATAVLQNRI